MLDVCFDTNRIFNEVGDNTNPSNLYYDGGHWWNEYVTDEEFNDNFAEEFAEGDYYYYEKSKLLVEFAKSQGRNATKAGLKGGHVAELMEQGLSSEEAKGIVAAVSG
jgi:hypothetical protein